MSHSREELIALCEEAIRPESSWHDRDSESAHRNIGEAWALLKAGCPFEIDRGMSPTTVDQTIWVRIMSKGFMYFETREEGDLRSDVFYIPTRARLERVGDDDWY